MKRITLQLELTDRQLERLTEMLHDELLATMRAAMRATLPLRGREAEVFRNTREIYDKLGALVGDALCADCGQRMFGARLDTHECLSCPPYCENRDMGTCPRCYEERGLGCGHGPLCDACVGDLVVEREV